MEVHEQAERKPGESQIPEQLCVVLFGECGDALALDDDQRLHNEIDALLSEHFSRVEHFEGDLSVGAKAAPAKFERERLFVELLTQAGSEERVNVHRTPDHTLGESIEFRRQVAVAHGSHVRRITAHSCVPLRALRKLLRALRGPASFSNP